MLIVSIKSEPKIVELYFILVILILYPPLKTISTANTDRLNIDKLCFKSFFAQNCKVYVYFEN